MALASDFAGNALWNGHPAGTSPAGYRRKVDGVIAAGLDQGALEIAAFFSRVIFAAGVIVVGLY